MNKKALQDYFISYLETENKYPKDAIRKDWVIEHNGVATMYIDFDGYETFSLYVRSDAETSCDYVIVSELDSTTEKISTSGNQNSGTAISNYSLVTYTNIDGGSHRITIKYIKDGSVNSGSDRGYVIIPHQ
jgi:hypothetical protein